MNCITKKALLFLCFTFQVILIQALSDKSLNAQDCKASLIENEASESERLDATMYLFPKHMNDTEVRRYGLNYDQGVVVGDMFKMVGVTFISISSTEWLNAFRDEHKEHMPDWFLYYEGTNGQWVRINYFLVSNRSERQFWYKNMDKDDERFMKRYFEFKCKSPPYHFYYINSFDRPIKAFNKFIRMAQTKDKLFTLHELACMFLLTETQNWAGQYPDAITFQDFISTNQAGKDETKGIIKVTAKIHYYDDGPIVFILKFTKRNRLKWVKAIPAPITNN